MIHRLDSVSRGLGLKPGWVIVLCFMSKIPYSYSALLCTGVGLGIGILTLYYSQGSLTKC